MVYLRLQSERARGESAIAQQASALSAARRARQQLQAQHERERAQLRERARRLERRLAALDSEYSAQLDSLRAAYQVSKCFIKQLLIPISNNKYIADFTVDFFLTILYIVDIKM